MVAGLVVVGGFVVVVVGGCVVVVGGFVVVVGGFVVVVGGFVVVVVVVTGGFVVVGVSPSVVLAGSFIAVLVVVCPSVAVFITVVGTARVAVEIVGAMVLEERPVVKVDMESPVVFLDDDTVTVAGSPEVLSKATFDVTAAMVADFGLVGEMDAADVVLVDTFVAGNDIAVALFVLVFIVKVVAKELVTVEAANDVLTGVEVDSAVVSCAVVKDGLVWKLLAGFVSAVWGFVAVVAEFLSTVIFELCVFASLVVSAEKIVVARDCVAMTVMSFFVD